MKKTFSSLLVFTVSAFNFSMNPLSQVRFSESIEKLKFVPDTIKNYMDLEGFRTFHINDGMKTCFLS